MQGAALTSNLRRHVENQHPQAFQAFALIGQWQAARQARDDDAAKAASKAKDESVPKSGQLTRWFSRKGSQVAMAREAGKKSSRRDVLFYMRLVHMLCDTLMPFHPFAAEGASPSMMMLHKERPARARQDQGGRQWRD